MGERVLYLDCASGVSGDMLLGALVDVGVPFTELTRELEKIPVRGFRLTRSKATRGGLRGTCIRVLTPDDRGYRHLTDFEKLLGRSRLSSGVKERSLALVRRLFEAEAAVHGEKPETVHLHELGSLDTLVDVVGAVSGISLLDVSEVVTSSINVGGGSVDTEHGRMTVPAPATALLLEGAMAHSDGDANDFERTTPTGALLATGLATRFGPFPAMTVRRVGYGLGTKDPEHGRPNALRVVLGEKAAENERVLVLEATVDDMTPEQLGYLQDNLLDAGVLDVFVTPVQMKKNRPGVNVTVLARPDQGGEVSRILFTEGTTLGVRYHEVQRAVLERRFVSVETRYGKVRVKEGLFGGKVVNRAPEFEDCRKLARARGVPLKAVQQAALGAGTKKRSTKR